MLCEEGTIMYRKFGKLLLILSLLSSVSYADFREHFDLGQTYLSQYQYASAIKEFRSALRINYMDTSARIGLVNAYFAQGAESANRNNDWEKAADSYRNALFYLMYYPNQDQVRNSAQAISQGKSNLEKCLRTINFDESFKNRYDTAKKLRAQGEFGAAAYEFNQALGDKSLQKDSFKQVGDIMNILGNKQKAEDYYRKAVAIGPSDLDLRLMYAKILDENNKDDEAIKEYAHVLSKSTSDNKEILYTLERTFKKKLEQKPNIANLHANLGAVLQKEGQFDEALSYYKQAESLDPSNINTRINVGTLYQQKEDYRTAIKAYESVLILYPDNVNALLYRAQCYDKLGETKNAQEGYKKVLALDPENPVIKQQMIDNVKKTSSPLQFVEYAKANFAKPSEIVYDYAIELHKAGKIDDSIYMYNEAIKLADANVEAEMFVNLSLVQAQGGKYDDAISTLNNAKSRFPDDKNIKNTLANVSGMKTDNLMQKASEYSANQDFQNAIATYLSINPPTVNTMLGVATSYQQLGDKDNAIEYYKKALELKPIDSDIAYYIAVLYGEKEDYNSAKEYLQKSITFNRNNQDAIAYLKSIEESEFSNLLNDAISKYEANDYDESLKEFNQILVKNPNNDYALYYRGMIYDAKNNKQAAIEDLKKAYSLNKDFAICNYLVASDYDSLGNYKEAYKYYNAYAQDESVQEDEYKKYAKDRAEELKNYASQASTAKK